MNYPKDLRVEKLILSSIIMDNSLIFQVSDLLTPDTFYQNEHKFIFEWMKATFDSKRPVDLISFTKFIMSDQRLRMKATDAPAFIKETVYGERFFSYCRILKELEMRRKLIDASLELAHKAQSEENDIFDLINEGQAKVSNISNFDSTSIYKIDKVIRDVLKQVAFNMDNDNHTTGIKTGLDYFDHFSGGLQRTDLVVVAGETSQGKTSLGLTILKNAALMSDAKCAVFSLEMSNMQLTARLMSQEAKISSRQILTSKLDMDTASELERSIDPLMKANIFFSDKVKQSLSSIANAARVMKNRFGLDIVVVDYLQLVKGDSNMTDEARNAYVARELKNLAIELDVAVILLSQLSRNKDNHKPTIARLRGSGQIEEAADVILLVWRPEVYEIEFFEDGSPTKDKAEIIIGKGRNIGTGSFLCGFKKETTLFHNTVEDLPSDVLMAKSAMPTYDPFAANPFNKMDDYDFRPF